MSYSFVLINLCKFDMSVNYNTVAFISIKYLLFSRFKVVKNKTSDTVCSFIHAWVTFVERLKNATLKVCTIYTFGFWDVISFVLVHDCLCDVKT